jgi:hypothetical protein
MICSICEIPIDDSDIVLNGKHYCNSCHYYFIELGYPILTKKESYIITANAYNYETFMIEHRHKIPKRTNDTRELYNII